MNDNNVLCFLKNKIYNVYTKIFKKKKIYLKVIIDNIVIYYNL